MSTDILSGAASRVIVGASDPFVTICAPRRDERSRLHYSKTMIASLLAFPGVCISTGVPGGYTLLGLFGGLALDEALA